MGFSMANKKRSKTPWECRIAGHGMENPEDLLANPKNWRIHPKEQQEGLESILDRVGWVQSVIVNRVTGHLVDGHLRVTLAMRRGETSIPVSYVDLSVGDEDLILATIDPLASLAGTDKDQLRQLLAGVDAQGDAGVEDLLTRVAKYGLKQPKGKEDREPSEKTCPHCGGEL